jgi:uncharacterized protein
MRQGGQHDSRRRPVAPTHRDTLVADNARWQTMLADDVVWELPFAPAIGHPARVSGREEVVQFAAWFVGAVENFRFST